MRLCNQFSFPLLLLQSLSLSLFIGRNCFVFHIATQSRSLVLPESCDRGARLRSSHPGPPLEPGQFHSCWVSLHQKLAQRPGNQQVHRQVRRSVVGGAHWATSFCVNSYCPAGDLAQSAASVITWTKQRFPRNAGVFLRSDRPSTTFFHICYDVMLPGTVKCCND